MAVDANYSIILDLDETLVSTKKDISDYVKILRKSKNKVKIRRRTYVIGLSDMNGTGRREPMWGVKRPHLKEFLKFCFEFFDVVAVWSAGTTDYVNKIVAEIFRGIGTPHIIWSRPMVVKGGGKPISKMIEWNQEFEQSMNLGNTFILDDKPYTFEKHNPDNGFLITPYDPEPSVEGIDEDDQTLLLLMDWIRENLTGKDIRKIDKQIFGN